MTDKRFIHDAYTTTFTADILDVREVNGQTAVILDRTWFYPEGGGQPADQGWIDGIEVTDVQYEGQDLLHFLESEPQGKKQVSCEINWTRRFDLMQQHSGQHLLSAAFEKLFEANTVGFHLSDTYVTIDLDQRLDAEAVRQAEDLCNEMIQKNLNVLDHYPDEAALSAMPLRKPPKVTKDIRVIEMGGFDFSPCGGTHVARTGEIGLIKVRKIENHKEGIRLEFICGKRALADYQLKNDLIYSIATDLSVRPEEVGPAYAKLKEDMTALQKANRLLNEQMTDATIDRLRQSARTVGAFRLITHVTQDMGMKDLKRVAATLATDPATVVLLALKEETVKFLFTRSQDVPCSMKEMIQPALALVEGRGGGSPVSAQGGGPLAEQTEAALELTVRQIESLLE